MINMTRTEIRSLVEGHISDALAGAEKENTRKWISKQSGMI